MPNLSTARLRLNPLVLSRAALATSCLLAAGIAYTLADTTWYFVAGSAEQPASATAGSTPVARPPTDVEAIIEAKLFGVVSQAPSTAVAAVETTLPLELLGVIDAEPDTRSAAVIAERQREGQLYWVGARNIPGGAELTEVHADHVILRRGGALEKLRLAELAQMPSMSQFSGADPAAFDNMAAEAADLPADELGLPAGFDANEPVPEPVPPEDAPPAPEDVPPQAANRSAREALEAYRERIASDPHAVLTEVGLVPVEAGNTLGYRVGAAGPNLARYGLQPGDVVLTVNNRQVGDVQRDASQVDAILAAGSARLEIQRGNRRFFVTTSLRGR